MSAKLNSAVIVSVTFILFGLSATNCRNSQHKESVAEFSSPFTVNQPAFPEERFNVIDFGAVGNGKSLDTEAIQKAIDSCAAKNGGIVDFPAGVYLTGTLFLSSSVNLHLMKGSVLLGSDRLEDYPETIQELRSYTDNYTVRSIIYAERKENIAITGEGIIDGQGAKFGVEYFPYKIRPYMIRMIECKNILIENISLLNSPMWVQHYLACDHLTIRDITVASRRANVNNDGIDIDGCHYVRITGCDISSEDDGLVFKSTMDRSCENIFVDKCRISSYASAVKMGTESNGGFRNIIIKDVEIYDTYSSGIALEIVDGGVLDGIDISDITMDRVNNPIFIRLGNRARPFIDGVPVTSIGSVRNINIRNVRGTNLGYFSEKLQSRGLGSRRTAHIPSSISGLQGHPVENVQLENIHLQYSGGHEQPYDFSRSIPEEEDKYPGNTMFGQLPAYGFYLRHANNIKFKNVIVETAKHDSRKLFFLDINTTNVSRDGETLNETAKSN